MANTIRICLRTDTAENWEAKNTILLAGELGYDQTNNRIKIGVTRILEDNQGKKTVENVPWRELPYVKPDVIDSLIGVSVTDALSAEQGRVLKALIDGKTSVQVINNLVTSDAEAALSAEQGVALKALIDGVISSVVTVVNNLTSTDTKNALSAAQGKVLNEKIPSVVNGLTSTDTKSALSAAQGKVLNEKIPTVTNSLTSNSTTAALSANQGRVLNNSKLDVSAVTNESWTFTLSTGKTVTKQVALWQ